MEGSCFMKVLIVNTSDIQGGAARAAYRLHQSLQKIEIDSKMLVQKKTSVDPAVISPDTKSRRLEAVLRPQFDKLTVNRYRNKTRTLFSPAWVPFSNVAERINNIKPDVVHLHWIAGGMLRIEELEKIKAPIVWSLHDMWAFTGGCHYDEDCGKFVAHCGKCPVLGSIKTSDLSYKIFNRKLKTYAKIKNLSVVGLSRWLAESAEQSLLFKNKHVVNLPNPIDTNVFKPLDKDIAREMLGIPEGKKIILFGAMSATSDPRKGFVELSSALKLLDMKGVELAVFGSNKPEAALNFNFPVCYLGRFHDDLSLSILYSAADVMVVPSLQENLSNVIMESLACGTPVVAFNIGGNPDMIDHWQNGYLAKPYDPADLACGINYVLEYPTPEVLRNNAVQKVQECFEAEKVALQYCRLYEEVIKNSKTRLW